MDALRGGQVSSPRQSMSSKDRIEAVLGIVDSIIEGIFNEATVSGIFVFIG
jgi:hypothetical protein